MEVKLTVYSKDLSKEELLALLQAMRDCEMRSFRDKTIAIWVEAPGVTKAEMKDILGKIHPPFAQHWDIPLKQSRQLKLGPRLITVVGKPMGTCGELTFQILEATEDEIKELEGARVIALARIGEG